MLEEGELEEQLKNALEADLNEISTLATSEFKRRALNDFETGSKGTSHSDSMPGSEPLSRKEFMFDGIKHSAASSRQGSKASLSSLASLPKGSKASLVSTTPPKGSKSSLVSTTPPKGSKSNLVSTTPPKGSKSNLASDMPLRGSAGKVNPTSETLPQESNTSFSSTLASEPSSQKEEKDLQEPSPAVTSVSIFYKVQTLRA